MSVRRDQNLLSPVNCWYLLLNQVRRESKDHATLSDIYLNNVIMRFMQISEDSTRLLKKVRVTPRQLGRDNRIIRIFQRGLPFEMHTVTKQFHCQVTTLTLKYIFRYVQHRFSILGPVVSFCELKLRNSGQRSSKCVSIHSPIL